VEALHQVPLPPYGLLAYLPRFTGATEVDTQWLENVEPVELDPSGQYYQVSLVTHIGEITTSLQLLERSGGPNGGGAAFDSIVMKQAYLDMSVKQDLSALTQALANATAITYTDASGFSLGSRTPPGTGGFLSKLGSGKQSIRRDPVTGVVLTPTHIFMQPVRHEFILAYVDAAGRPIVTPQAVKPRAIQMGATGTTLASLPVYIDNSIPTPGTGADQVVVMDADEVYCWREDAPRFQVLPAFGAAQLSVLIKCYAYCACLPRYISAVSTISGSGMSAISL